MADEASIAQDPTQLPSPGEKSEEKAILSNEASDATLEEKHGFVGRTISKEFTPHGKFTGTVESFDAARNLWKVQYDDGDEEELDFKEMDKLLQEEETNQDGSSSGSEAKAQAKRKRKPHVGPKYSRFAGVTQSKCRRSQTSHSSLASWGAQIVVNGQAVHLGTFASEEDAARAYNVHAARLGKPVNTGLSPAHACKATMEWTTEEDQHLIDLVGSEDPAARFSFPGKGREDLVSRWKELHIRIKATPASERTTQEVKWLETLLLNAPRSDAGMMVPRMQVSQLEGHFSTHRAKSERRARHTLGCALSEDLAYPLDLMGMLFRSGA